MEVIEYQGIHGGIVKFHGGIVKFNHGYRVNELTIELSRAVIHTRLQGGRE